MKINKDKIPNYSFLISALCIYDINTIFRIIVYLYRAIFKTAGPIFTGFSQTADITGSNLCIFIFANCQTYIFKFQSGCENTLA